MGASERRGDTGVVLPHPVPATVSFAIGADELAVAVVVQAVSDRTVLVAVPSGAEALALAVTADCELLLTVEGLAVVIHARPGRRSTDIPTSQQVELVAVDAALDLRLLPWPLVEGS